MDQITQPGKRSRAKVRPILVAYADRLKGLDGVNERNVILSDQPIPRFLPQSELAFSVSMGGGSFTERLWNGGHHRTAGTEAHLTTSVFVRVLKDSPGRKKSALLDESAAWDWFERILAHLTVAEPEKGPDSQPWEPSTNGIPLLRNIPTPSHFSDCLEVPNHVGWIGISLVWSIEFDWNLYGGT